MSLRLTLWFGIIFSGCTTTVRFKLEDSRSLEPIENVAVFCTERKFVGIFDSKLIRHPVLYTSSNGLVEIRVRNRSSSFVFQKEGYDQTAVLADFREQRPILRLFSPVSTNAAQEPVCTPVPKRRTEFRVPLHSIN